MITENFYWEKRGRKSFKTVGYEFNSFSQLCNFYEGLKKINSVS